MNSTPASVAGAIGREIESGLFPGAVVMLGRPGEILCHEAFGYARIRPTHVPMQPDSIFDLASVTKVVATATAAAICIDDGILALSDRVSAYLPSFNAPGAEEVTIAQLGAHVGGLDNTRFDNLTGEAMLEALVAAPLARAPESDYEYTCRAFILLGLVVEAATGRSLAEFCDERIFHPLEMLDTHFAPFVDPSRLAGNERETPGHISDEQAQSAGRPIGNAGLFSNAPDLARFAEMMLGCGAREGVRILSEATHGRITTRLSPANLPARGFGWDLRPPEISPARGRLLSASAYGHTGWTGQSLYVDPERDIYLIVLTNRTHPARQENHEATAIARARIADALIGAFLN